MATEQRADADDLLQDARVREVAEVEPRTSRWQRAGRRVHCACAQLIGKVLVNTRDLQVPQLVLLRAHMSDQTFSTVTASFWSYSLRAWESIWQKFTHKTMREENMTRTTIFALLCRSGAFQWVPCRQLGRSVLCPVTERTAGREPGAASHLVTSPGRRSAASRPSRASERERGSGASRGARSAAAPTPGLLATRREARRTVNITVVVLHLTTSNTTFWR